MLPYTPLHHLLLAELDRPIVATSGNLTDETICIDNDEAAKRLGHIADGFLTHDRPIVRHVDDSIVAFVADQPAIMRRARGFAPLPIHLSRTLPAILAVGPHMKNTVAIAVEDNVFVSQHIGDLDTLPSRETFVQTINAFKELYRFEPEVIACDLHPDYASTHYAIDSGLPVVQVQHHYSHALSCMAEHDLHGDVLAVVWDGTGWGPDGTIWGGEFLTVNDAGYERAAAFRSFPLPGGDAAVREPRRSALGAIYEASGAAGLEESAAIDAFSDVELKVLTSALRTQTNSPRTSSAGRLFDTVAALTGICCRSTFEGQAAMQLEFAIDQDAAVAPFDYSIREHSDTVAYAPELTVDWFPILQNIICELRSQTVPAVIAARFHRTLIDIIVDVAGRLSYDRVVLSGGCFQNRWLIEHAIVRLRRVGITPYWHRQVPPNDGGVALGQIIAAAREI
jgi:hydrogenase maturation protein HypF